MKMHQVQVPMEELNLVQRSEKKNPENYSEQTTSREMVIKRAVLYITQTRLQEIFSKIRQLYYISVN